jgi:hypothetical protein
MPKVNRRRLATKRFVLDMGFKTVEEYLIWWKGIRLAKKKLNLKIDFDEQPPRMKEITDWFEFGKVQASIASTQYSAVESNTMDQAVVASEVVPSTSTRTFVQKWNPTVHTCTCMLSQCCTHDVMYSYAYCK